MENSRLGIYNSLFEIKDSRIFNQMFELFEGEHAVMFLMYDSATPMSPTKLSECLYVTKARVTAIINSLCEKGFVEIKRQEEDRRKVLVYLTNSGNEYIEGKLNEINRQLQSIFNYLGTEKCATLLEIINEIGHHLKGMDNE